MNVFENTVSVNAESALLNMLFPALLAIFVSLLVFSRQICNQLRIHDEV